MSSTQGRGLEENHKSLFTGGRDPLLPALIKSINRSSEIEITVSFIQRSGLDLIFDALVEALNSGAKLTIITSDYLDITCPIALREMLSLQDRGAEVRIFQTKNAQSFHMKAYIFSKYDTQGKDVMEGYAYIGSNNLSKSALTKGLEWCFRHSYFSSQAEKAVDPFFEFKSAFRELLEHKNVKLLSHEWIDDYIQRRQKPQYKFVAAGEDEELFEIPPPRLHQQVALERLIKTRIEGFSRGLVVLATGMGKTWLAAFDVKQFRAKRVLFVAHREEILLQAKRTFARLLDLKTGLLNAGKKHYDAQCLFASVQTISKSQHLSQFCSTHFDYIIIDEFHHASSKVYQSVLNHFNPKFLLGLTATPERSDQADILNLCDNNLVYECNLIEGIESECLVPFEYHGIWDESVDYKEIPWRNGKFDPNELSNQFATNQRAKHAFKHWTKLAKKQTLAFCISTSHADFMSQAFNGLGIRSLSVHSKSEIRRNEALTLLETGEIQVLFCVDLFNEGTDLPSIDTVMMLRPSESKIIFLQQLGRGLRTHEGKSHLVVMDFIGNHHSFLNKPFALFSANSVKRVLSEIREPKLPDGCFINFDIQITDFWEQLVKQQRTTAKEDYLALTASLGHFPTACEFFHEYGSLSKVKKQNGSWFELVHSLNPKFFEPLSSFDLYKDFLFEGVEKTSMTKCFKAILLEAFVSLDGLNSPPTLKVLAEQSYKILARYPQLKALELPQKYHDENPRSKAWFDYWVNNPINAFTGIKKKKTSKVEKYWFIVELATNSRLEEAKLALNNQLIKSDVKSLEQCILELTQYRLANHLTNRLEKEGSAVLTLPSPVTKPKSTIVQIIDDNRLELPYFPNLKIACGHFKNGDGEIIESVKIPDVFGRLDTEKHFLARASGNSMNGGRNPILDGQLLLLELITPSNAGSLQNQTIAIERQDESGDDQYLLRDIKKITNEYGEPQYHLIAKNPDYELIVANEEMRTFARLKAVIVE